MRENYKCRMEDPIAALVGELYGQAEIAHAVALNLAEAHAPADITAGLQDPAMQPIDWVDLALDGVRAHGSEEDKELYEALRFSAL